MAAQLVLDTALSRYAVSDLLGEGGSGRVYRVTDEEGKSFAAKILTAETATKAKRRRFKNEIAFAERSRHPNIIRLSDHGVLRTEGGASPFFIMPLYDRSLRKVMDAGLTPADAISLFMQMLDGVEAGHLLGAIHRDLKPENVLSDTGAQILVIADWGIAQFTEDLLITLVETRPNERLANFEYAAPEQRRRGGTIDIRADIYALGLILYEMLMGEVPHGTNCPPIGEKHPDYAFVDEIVNSMRSQSPAARPSSISVVKQRLAASRSLSVTEQKLSILKDTVVPVGTVDDALVEDPIRLERIDFIDGRIYFVFHRMANSKWFQAFQTMNWQNAPAGKKPSEYQFHGNAVSIDVQDDREAEQVIKLFEPWIPRTSEQYRSDREQEQRVALEQMRHVLRKQTEDAERERKILDAIRRAAQPK